MRPRLPLSSWLSLTTRSTGAAAFGAFLKCTALCSRTLTRLTPTRGHEGSGSFASTECHTLILCATQLYEDRERKEGKQVNHGFAKELIAGIAGAFILLPFGF